MLSPRQAATATWALNVNECVRRVRRATTVVLYIRIRPIVMTSQHTYRTVDLNGTRYVYQSSSDCCVTYTIHVEPVVSGFEDFPPTIS